MKEILSSLDNPKKEIHIKLHSADAITSEISLNIDGSIYLNNNIGTTIEAIVTRVAFIIT